MGEREASLELLEEELENVRGARSVASNLYVELFMPAMSWVEKSFTDGAAARAAAWQRRGSGVAAAGVGGVSGGKNPRCSVLTIALVQVGLYRGMRMRMHLPLLYQLAEE